MLAADDSRVVTQQRLVNKLTDDFRRLQERDETKAAAFRAASQALANVETWLKSGVPGSTTLEAVETEPPPLKKGEDVLDAVEARRRRVRELRADKHRVESAAYPSSHAKAKMRQQIEQLAMQGAPSVSRLVELDGPVEFQMQRLRSDVIGAEQRALAFAEVTDTLALFAWLHRDLLIKRLDEEISSESDDGAALSHTDRELRSAEIQGDMLDIERQEAALTWSAIEQGLPCEFRADCSPLAILQVRLVTTPRATELPETSLGLSWLRK